MTNLILTRTILTPQCTLSKLNIEGINYIWETLEDVTRDLNHNGHVSDEGKVYGQTAVPYGRWKCEFRHSPSKNKTMLYFDCNDFTSTMFHSGTSVKDTLGCILVARKSILVEEELYELRESKLGYADFIESIALKTNHKFTWIDRSNLKYTIEETPESDKEIYLTVK